MVLLVLGLGLLVVLAMHVLLTRLLQ